MINLNEFDIKTKILFGRGGFNNLGDVAQQIGAKNVLIVSDASMDKLGFVETAHNILKKQKISSVAYTQVDPEPYLDNAELAAALGTKNNSDLVIGLGGGSAMDTAKAASILMTNVGKAEDYVGLNKVELPGVSTLMIPTTSGTGSEVTFTAVFTNRETKAKGGINSPYLFPDVALLDPELTTSLPSAITAATGMDALTHAIESVTSKSCSIFTEALSYTAIKLIAQNLRKAVFNGNEIVPRENMLYASLLAGMALAISGVGAAHALAYPLGGFYRIPHGMANAMLIGHVMEFNLPAAEEKFAGVAKALGEPVDGLPPRLAGSAAVESVKALCADIGIPQSLHDVDVPLEDIPKMVESALKVTRPVENNPRTLGPTEAEMIYLRAFMQ